MVQLSSHYYIHGLWSVGNHFIKDYTRVCIQIPAELITLDGDSLTGVDVPTVQEQIVERNKKIFIKPANIEFDPRHKMKGKGGSAKRHHIRKAVIEQARNTNLKGDLGKFYISFSLKALFVLFYNILKKERI